MAKKKTYGQQLTERMIKSKTCRKELATWCRVSVVQTYHWTGDTQAPSATAKQAIELFFQLKNQHPAVWAGFMEQFAKI